MLFRWWEARDFLTTAATEQERRQHRQRVTSLLGCEHLEIRWLMSAVAFQASSFSVNEDAGKALITVVLDAPAQQPVTVNYASSGGTATPTSDYNPASGTLTFNANETSKTFAVFITDDDLSEGSETVPLTLSSPTNATLGSPSSATLTISNVTPSAWTTTGQQRRTDPAQGTLVPFGEVWVAPQDGSLHLEHPLDYRQGSGGPLDSWSGVGGLPALVYNANTVNVKPVLETTLRSTTTASVPTQITAELTWNGGMPQPGTPFLTTGHTAGDDYLLSVQVFSPVTASGKYSWSVRLQASFSDRGAVVRTVSGTAYVVVQGSSSPFGYGWSLAGLDQLVADAAGVLWVAGFGGSRYFSGSGGTYASPANDFGVLVKNADNTYTYTAKDQTKWDFDTAGLLHLL